MDARSSRRFAVLGLSLAVAGAACAFQPAAAADNYGDCILQHVSSGMDTDVVAVIRSACRSKFPAETDEVAADADAVALDAEELARLEFRRGGGNNATLWGILYNGNPDLTLTEVDISLPSGGEQAHVYRARQTVPPYGTATVQLTILPVDGAQPERAAVAAAKGRPAQ